MDNALNDQIHNLCLRIAVEKDHDKFLALVEELSRILSVRQSADNLENRKAE
jgi:hypothetical protein